MSTLGNLARVTLISLACGGCMPSACSIVEEEVLCGPGYSLATLQTYRSSIPTYFTGVHCEMSRCDEGDANYVEAAAKKLRLMADKEPDRCVAASLRNWAWYVERELSGARSVMRSYAAVDEAKRRVADSIRGQQ